MSFLLRQELEHTPPIRGTPEKLPVLATPLKFLATPAAFRQVDHHAGPLFTCMSELVKLHADR